MGQLGLRTRLADLGIGATLRNMEGRRSSAHSVARSLSCRRRASTWLNRLTMSVPGLRHSFTSRAMALVETLPMLGRILGHTQVQTTTGYARIVRNSGVGPHQLGQFTTAFDRVGQGFPRASRRWYSPCCGAPPYRRQRKRTPVCEHSVRMYANISSKSTASPRVSPSSAKQDRAEEQCCHCSNEARASWGARILWRWRLLPIMSQFGKFLLRTTRISPRWRTPWKMASSRFGSDPAFRAMVPILVT